MTRRARYATPGTPAAGLGVVTLVVTFVLALSGCTSASAGTGADVADCKTSPVEGWSDGEGFREAQLTSDGVEGWALLWSEPPWDVDEETKVVLRLTGSGNVRAVALGPDDSRVDPVWLEQHSGSNWDRPGDEWGTGWSLPAPGCWEIRLSRAEGHASLWLEVAEPA